MPYGPNRFNVDLFDTFATNHPNDDDGQQRVHAIVGVTVNWDFNRTQVVTSQNNPAGITFAKTQWLEAGQGPLAVYEDKIGAGSTLVGQVKWDLFFDSYPVVENDAPQNRHRNIYVIVLQLLRTFTPVNGSPQTVLAVDNSQRDVGIWIPNA